MAKIERIGVIGAGQMGAGIAQVSAQSGFPTFLWDAAPGATTKARASIEKRLDRAIEKEKIAPAEKTTTLNNLQFLENIADFSGCELLIEAIIEKEEVKLKLFGELREVLHPEAIVVSNTSSISITRLATGLPHPERFMGMHFMNPVPVMELVELIRGLQTSDETFAAVEQVAAQMGKTTVLGIDTPGFIVNRILCPMLNEAIFLLQEGVAPEDIDQAMKLGTNHPMGPLELADFVGLDTLLYILELLHCELGEDKYRPCPLLRNYVHAGWLGKKTGRGFYQY